MIVLRSTGALILVALVMSGAHVIGCDASKTEDAGGKVAITGIHPAAVPDGAENVPIISLSGPDKGNGNIIESAADDGAGDAVDVMDSDEKESNEQAALDEAFELTETAREYLDSGDEEEALEALDEAYALTIRVNPGSDLELVRQIDEIRSFIYRIIVELYWLRYAPENGARKTMTVTAHGYGNGKLSGYFP